MPNRLHPAKWGPKDRTFDEFVGKLVAERGFGHEREYVGVVELERANEVRRGMRNAGRHLGVSVKAFWKPCPTGCAEGGPECRYHISFTAYDPEVARAYKNQQSAPNNEAR